MQVSLFRRSTVDDQAAVASGLPRNLITIDGWTDELQEPRPFIKHAIKAFGSSKLVGKKREIVALKIIGLLSTASLRAQKIRDWSRDGDYDPLPDFLTLRRLAADRFGTVRDDLHPATQLRETLNETVAILRERPA